MNALLVLSLRALLPMKVLERDACAAALSFFEFGARVSADDLCRSPGSVSLTNALAQLERSEGVDGLVDLYLDALNNRVWDTSKQGYRSTRLLLKAAWMERKAIALVSEYPLLTTNITRATALRTEATRLGKMCVSEDARQAFDAGHALIDAARQLSVLPSKCHVVTASPHHAMIAAEVGMRAGVVDEIACQRRFDTRSAILRGVSSCSAASPSRQVEVITA